MRFNKILFKLILLIMATPLIAGESFALNGGAGISASNGTVTTNSTSTNFISNSASLSCSSSAGKLIVDSTADTLSYCSSGGSTVKYAALGNDSGESTAAGANSVDMPGDTTGNYVSDISGTSNQIEVSLTPAENATATLSLPSDIDIGGKTSFEIPNAAAPSVTVFGQIAGDNNLWGASRGAVVAYDGTASTALVGALVSDTPVDKQVPQYNTGGTVTWEYTNGEYDARSLGMACDGTTNDKTAFDAAYDALTTNGGTIVIPAGKTCMVGSDVNVESNVRLKCQPGGTIKAVSGGTWILGVMEWFDGAGLANDSPVEGCNFDLNGEHTPGVSVFGTRNSVTRSRFYGGDTSNGSAWNMVYYGCSGAGCEFAQNQIACADTLGANDTGLGIAGSTAAGELSVARNNSIKNCDLYGINVTAGNVNVVNNSVAATSTTTATVGIANAGSGDVVGNTVSISGSSGYGISLTATNQAVSNRVTVSGASGVGISMDANYNTVSANRVVVSGTGGKAFWAKALGATITGNTYELTSVTGGTDNAEGIHVGDGGSFDWYNNITGNVGSVTTTDSQTHVVLGGTLSVISGNIFNSGKYGVVPSQASIAEFGSGFNVNITGNRFYVIGTTAIIAVNGFIITGNYIAWMPSGSTAAIELGDDRTMKSGNSHTNITGNLIHTNNTGVIGVKANEIEKTCDGGSKQYQACTTDDTNASTGCPGATCTGCCDTNTVGISGIQIVGNHFLWNFADAGNAIDLSQGLSSASGDLYNWVIAGNTFDNNTVAADSVAAIECSASNQSKVHDIEVGVNSYAGYTVATGDTSEGRIGMNCTPDMIDDVDTTLMWFPAAGCNGSSAYPAYDLPTSSAPTAVCYGSNIRRGFLSYPNSSDTAGFVGWSLPSTNSYQFFVKPIYTVDTANTTSTRWGFTIKCQENNNDVDNTWSETEANMDTAFINNAYDFMVPTTYTTVGAVVCAKPVVTMRVRRIGSNSTAGQDDQVQASLLHGVQVWVRKQD